MSDVHLDVLVRGARRVVPPHRVDQLIDEHHAAAPAQQERQQQPLLERARVELDGGSGPAVLSSAVSGPRMLKPIPISPVHPRPAEAGPGLGVGPEPSTASAHRTPTRCPLARNSRRAAPRRPGGLRALAGRAQHVRAVELRGRQAGDRVGARRQRAARAPAARTAAARSPRTTASARALTPPTSASTSGSGADRDRLGHAERVGGPPLLEQGPGQPGGRGGGGERVTVPPAGLLGRAQQRLRLAPLPGQAFDPARRRSAWPRPRRRARAR